MTVETATIDLVPNQPKTPMHSFRCDDELWEAGKAAAAARGTTLAAVLRDAIRALVAADAEDRLTILANSNVTRGKFAAAAVHAALTHYGIPHGAVIVLGASPTQIEEGCDVVIRDSGRTEVEPGTITAGVERGAVTE